jgi:cyclic peptide transporter
MQRRIVFAFLVFSAFCAPVLRVRAGDSTLDRRIADYVEKTRQEAHIPGLSLVIIDSGRTVIRSFGVTDLATRQPVTPATLFQLGSCSKAFTALAVLDLEQRGRVRLDDAVSQYIPWLHLRYHGQDVPVTLRQLLHHTSGIGWTSLSKIPQDSGAGALEHTVRALDGENLSALPGKRYEYATVNYDILALVIQRVSGLPFETYLRQRILAPLGLDATSIGAPVDSSRLASGYKIGFFRPRAFRAPVFAGNNAAGYVVSDAEDMARWLRFQMGLDPSVLFPLAKATQQRDESVALHGMSSYAMGWDVSLDGTGEISHGGLNPNYTAFVGFRPGSRTGVVVLANSNSNFTPIIGGNVLKLLAGGSIQKEFNPDDSVDRTLSMVAILLGGYLLVILGFLSSVLVDIAKGRRVYESFSAGHIRKFGVALLAIVPLLYGLYILPRALGGFSWPTAIVWFPVSLPVAICGIGLSIVLSYGIYLLTLCYPQPNKFRKIAPRIILMSVLSGIANMLLIILISSSLTSSVPVRYLVFYYLLTFATYFLGRRFVQTSLIKFSRGVVYEIRLRLFDKLFSTSYQRFEKLDIGRIYTALNEDVGTIGESTNTIVTLMTSLFTAGGAFLYLSSIAFWATLLTFLLIGALSGIYYFVSRSTNKYFQQARDTRNDFVRLTSGMIDGFKELSLHRNKKLEYKKDIGHSADRYRIKISTALTRFVNASLIGESLLIILLGTVAFAVPRIFPGIEISRLMSFIIVLLYLMGPINSVLSSVPAVMQLKIAWDRIKQFLQEIPANQDLAALPASADRHFEKLEARGVGYQHGQRSGKGFAVGPIDLEVRQGEILFIIGGNGSGKTTLAKLLTGLYEADKGKILINGRVTGAAQLGEYYSVVFSPVCLFEKLYDIDCAGKTADIDRYLKLLDLDHKVSIADNRYSTVQLSGGQRKRLALLQCYLEDRPIYLFDEWAADQDPTYRNFFYRTLLPEMKKAGKTIIAITHDDHYFDVADRVLKMNQGQLEPLDIPLTTFF